jgi:hypothetical protein
VYKVECKTETVKGFRCETVPVEKTRTVSCVERVPVVKEEVRKVCHKVTVCEEREVCKKVWKTVEETVNRQRLVSLGHWEERESSGCGLFGGHGGHGHGGCNDSCNNSCNDNCCARTHKHWVFCPQYECCPTKVCKKVCVEEKCKVKVPVCKNEWKEEKVKVCTYECKTTQRQEKYTECVTRQVPCDVTRTVRVCVPHEETVTCTRMVRREVCREVPCAPAHNACNDSCHQSLCDRLHDALGRMRSNGCCERDSCGHGHRDNCCH